MTVRTPLVGLAGIRPRRVMRKLRRLPCSRAELSPNDQRARSRPVRSRDRRRPVPPPLAPTSQMALWPDWGPCSMRRHVSRVSEAVGTQHPRRRFQPRRAFRQGDASSSSFLQLGSVSTRAAGRRDLLRVRGASHPSREHHLLRIESARPLQDRSRWPRPTPPSVCVVSRRYCGKVYPAQRV